MVLSTNGTLTSVSADDLPDITTKHETLNIRTSACFADIEIRNIGWFNRSTGDLGYSRRKSATLRPDHGCLIRCALLPCRTSLPVSASTKAKYGDSKAWCHVNMYDETRCPLQLLLFFCHVFLQVATFPMALIGISDCRPSSTKPAMAATSTPCAAKRTTTDVAATVYASTSSTTRSGGKAAQILPGEIRLVFNYA